MNDLKAAALKHTVSSSRPNQNVSPLHNRNIIAVASGKGGVGKTWFSITLAQTLSNLGKNILLFDGDVGLANVDIQLGLMIEKDLSTVIEGRSTLEGAITRFPEGGFDLICGRSGSASLANLSPQRVAELRNDLSSTASKYDRVLIDLGAGVDKTVRQLTGPAATVLVLTTDEPTSMTDAYAFMKMTLATNPNAKLKLVVNMAATKSEGMRTYQALQKSCKKFLNYDLDLAGIIHRDERVKDAIRSQTSFLIRSPNSRAAEDVEALAKALINSGG